MTYVGKLPVEPNTSKNSISPGMMLRDGRAPLPLAATRRYNTLSLTHEESEGIAWARMAPPGRPNCSMAVLEDWGDMRVHMKEMFDASQAAGLGKPFGYFVLGSDCPGVYSLGGDLQLFVESARAGDRDTIQRYARMCANLAYDNSVGFGLPIVTIALVQGDALGGGMEIAMQWDMIVAERSAKFGLPEILFGLFPGMGAYSFLSRRIAPAKAKEMILTGRIYSAEEMHAAGIVDVLAEDGQGEAAIYSHVKKMAGKHNAERAFYNTRRRVNPVTRQELLDVVDTWADAVFELTEADFRKMDYLVARQDRRLRKAAIPSAAE
jgi:DSF synthase